MSVVGIEFIWPEGVTIFVEFTPFCLAVIHLSFFNIMYLGLSGLIKFVVVDGYRFINS
jgi:hypothetical protein